MKNDEKQKKNGVLLWMSWSVCILSTVDSWYMGTCGTESYMQVFHVRMTHGDIWLKWEAGRSYRGLGCDDQYTAYFPLREEFVMAGN